MREIHGLASVKFGKSDRADVMVRELEKEVALVFQEAHSVSRKQVVLTPEQARHLATMLDNAADRVEGKGGDLTISFDAPIVEREVIPATAPVEDGGEV